MAGPSKDMLDAQIRYSFGRFGRATGWSPDEMAQPGEVGHNTRAPAGVTAEGIDSSPAMRRNAEDFIANYGRPMDEFLDQQYPGLEHLLPSIQESPGTAGAVRMSEIADSLEATQHQGVDALSNVAEGIDPAALSDPLRAREARSEEHTSELQSRENLVCRLL